MNCPLCGQWFEARCPSCGWRGWRRFAAFIFILAVSTGQFWHVTWDAVPYQSAIIAITECMNAKKLYVFDRQPLVEDGQGSADIRRQLTPAGERCTVRIQLMVASDEFGNDEYISPGNSIIITQED